MDSLRKIVEDLKQEAARIQIQGRALTPAEMARVQAIHQALPHLHQAIDVLGVETKSTLITYKIVSDIDGRLKQAARIACNFWNRFVIPNTSIVVRLGVFTSDSLTIARAYEPYQKEGVLYGIVEFNAKYLTTFSKNETAGTIVHEIGHTLGFGFAKWRNLFGSDGVFNESARSAVHDLENMRVETDYGSGTRFAHWDEERHDNELMTGFKDKTEYVLPVTIAVMPLLGHRIAEQLPQKTNLDTLLDMLAQVIFSRQTEAKAINLDHFEETELMETIPHNQSSSSGRR